MKVCRHLTLLAGLFFCAPLPVAAESTSLTDDDLVRNFGIIAFGDEFREVKDPRLIKWTKPLKVYTRIEAPMGAADLAFLDDHLGRLRAITGITIDQVKSEKDANFVIVFTNESKFSDLAMNHLGVSDRRRRADMGRRIANSNCVAYFRSDNRSYTIHEAMILIPVDRAKSRGILDLCIVEETSQAMGLPNDSDDVNPSIFNDSSPLSDLTEHDIMLLKMLYDPRMTPGMRQVEALAMAQEILPNIRRLKPVRRPPLTGSP
ncbi:MAG: DUF2927 domain-containing protein [Alphaproteobacteria bacterium]|nr:DUF2927 domain-containing protein [Alphaproteobacteria bacterium]